jgi:uncharacterized membrane protein (UPF0127 family)
MSRNILIFAVILLILVIIAFFALGGGKRSILGGKTATLHGHTIKLEIADTDAEQMKGLSDRDSLAKDSGMLFLFKQPGIYPFWMKDMRFSIDIIFLRDLKVVSIYNSVQPFITAGGVKQQNLTNYPPAAPSDRVLELNAGQAKEFGLQVGDEIAIKL